MTRLPLLSLPLLVACMHAGPPKDLGDLPLDTAPLAETPDLAHLQAVSDASTVADLFADDLAIRAAPDPTPRMVEVAADNAQRASEGVELSVLSFNVALLDANVFGVIPFAETPHLKERRPVLPELVTSAGYDVLLLQEIWRRRDVRAFVEAGEAHGYVAHVGPRGRYDDGLLILVKEDLGPIVDEGDEWYRQRDGLEYFPGPKIKRGYSWVVVDHPQAGILAFFDTHMLAWPDNWQVRMSQARQLGLSVREITTAYGPQAVAIVGGDLNGGPYYPRDAWVVPGGEGHTGWWANTLSYGLLLHYGGLEDLYVLGRSPEEADDDREQGDAIPNLPDKALAEPMGDASWCEATHGRWFTATDCTALYFEQYAGTEYPARMDHLMVRDPQSRVHVGSSGITFSEDQVFGELPPMPPSDHLAVEAHLSIAPPAESR